MNNNAKLRQYLTSSTNNASITLGITGRQIADASQAQLKSWVEQMGGDPVAILGTPAPVPMAQTHALTAAEIQLKAIQDALGGGSSINMDEVRDVVQQAIANDVAPSIEKIQSKVDALAPLADTLDKIADAMKGGTSSRLPLAVAVASGEDAGFPSAPARCGWHQAL